MDVVRPKFADSRHLIWIFVWNLDFGQRQWRLFKPGMHIYAPARKFAVLFLLHFLRCFVILHSKTYQMSHTEVKNCQIVEIRLINMKINKEKLLFHSLVEINAWKLPSKIGLFSEFLVTGRAYFCPIFQFWGKIFHLFPRNKCRKNISPFS